MDKDNEEYTEAEQKKFRERYKESLRNEGLLPSAEETPEQEAPSDSDKNFTGTGYKAPWQR
jgi:hypothetical protein